MIYIHWLPVDNFPTFQESYHSSFVSSLSSFVLVSAALFVVAVFVSTCYSGYLISIFSVDLFVSDCFQFTLEIIRVSLSSPYINQPDIGCKKRCRRLLFNAFLGL